MENRGQSGTVPASMPKVTSPRELVAMFREHGLEPRKRLGQNFLVDANIAGKIIAAIAPKPGDSVVEVGPGAGALTVPLLRAGVRLLAVEIDRGLVALLREMLGSHLQAGIMQGDVLAINWGEFVGEHYPAGTPVKLVSNLPYNISGPFMYSLFKAGFPFSEAVLMFQKEVAGRLAASPGDGDYGELSVLCSYYTRRKILFSVSGNVFWPRPEVGSAVIRLERRERTLSRDQEKLFLTIVKGVFQQRRKTILSNFSRVFSLERAEASDLLHQAEVDPSVRPEQLSAQQFAKLTLIAYNEFSTFC